MKQKVAALILAVAFVATGAVYAHHSFAATYYVDREITVKGTITQFFYRNPHSFVKIEAPDESGHMVTWSIEWGGGAQLTHDHVSRDTLRPGDVVIATGNPGRDSNEHRIRLHKIVRPSDGWKWEGVIM